MRMNRPVAPRKAVNLSLDAALVAEAKALDLNLSRTLEEALRARVREEKARRWQENNAEAIRLSNEELERNGLWSDEHRLF
jgi:antitoxin CcdA